ncbi:MAG: protein deglycase HchA, partial [Flavobacteriaceae bacterium]|nr:protein deglycase HchA [Flavobacteriaceae bacterium]
MLKKLFGIAPQPTEDGAFIPSKLALKLATSDKTDFDNTVYKNKYQGNKKILMVCTEEHNMVMENGKKFSTGNHPVEMLLPMLHLKNAGFDV